MCLFGLVWFGLELPSASDDSGFVILMWMAEHQTRAFATDAGDD